MENKGLLIVYNAHNLLEFVWYYCTEPEARNMSWDALCLPSGVNGEYMSPYCEKSELFENVYKDDKAYSDESLGKQLALFAKMLGYFIVGQRKKLCRKQLKKYVDIDKYGKIVVLSDFGIVSGMAIGTGIESAILEDGTADYRVRSNKNILRGFYNPFAWKGFLIAKLGYANTAYFYPLKTTAKCVKYSSHPEMMAYRNYKEIRRLFDFSATDIELYNSILKKLYSSIDRCDFDAADTVIFTNNIEDFTYGPDEYIKRFGDYISRNSNNVLLKKHPRDTTKYVFDDSVTVQEIDQTIPAEVIFPYILGKKIYFLWPSSIVLYMDSKDYRLSCLYFDGLSDISKKETTHCDYLSLDELRSIFEKFGASDMEYTII